MLINQYDLEKHHDVKETLDLLNELALMDEETSCISYPKGDPEGYLVATGKLENKLSEVFIPGLQVISFDIDLTLDIGDDDDQNLILIEPEVITRLQRLGYIVGTSSDRSVENQKETLRKLGQTPHFCIPKDMLGWTKMLLSAESYVHVGDDQLRDRNIALAAGWEHQWPYEFREPT